MLNINAERCFITGVIYIDIGILNSDKADYTTLTATSAHMHQGEIKIAEGTLQEMKDLKAKIIPYLCQRPKPGYFDIATESWVEHNR